MVDMFFISSNYIKCLILLVILLLVGIEAIAFVVNLLPLSPRLLALLPPHLPHHLMLPHHLRRHSSVAHVGLSRQTLSPRVHLRLPLRPEVSLLTEHPHSPLSVVGILVPVDSEHGGRIGVSRAYD